MAYPFSSRSSWPRNQTGVSCIERESIQLVNLDGRQSYFHTSEKLCIRILQPLKNMVFPNGEVPDLGSGVAPVSCRPYRKIWPWSTEWSRAKANTVLPRERTGYSKHPLPTTQEKTLHMDITRWSISKSGWLYSLKPKMEKLYTVSKNKTRSWLWLTSWTPYCQIQTKIEETGENHYHSGMT